MFYPEVLPDPAYAIGIEFAVHGTTLQYDAELNIICTAGCKYWFSPWWNIENHLSRYFDP